MQLTEHFNLVEFTRSTTADRKGIYNEPDSEIVGRLRDLATFLEHLRFSIGRPIHILSGYRGAALNAAVGGSIGSAHRLGYAADIIVPAGPGRGDIGYVAQRIYHGFRRFDQVIEEPSPNGGWVHVSIDPRFRGQFLRRVGSGEYVHVRSPRTWP